jgi:hypothetical protein
MVSPRPWPFDDDDRPSGSVRPLSQADLQAILAHLGDDSDELLAWTGADRPVVAVPVRASVGRPGGSAQARWRRARASEWAAWTRTLPWRVAAILGIGAGGGSPRQPRSAQARAGPRRAGCRGGRLGTAIPAQPGRCRLAAQVGEGAAHRPTARPPRAARVGGPARPVRPQQPGQHRPPGDRPWWGVRDRLQAISRPPPTRLIRAALAWPHPLASILRVVGFQADQAAQVLPDPDVTVVPIVAVHGAQVAWGKVVMDGVPVVSARRLPNMLRALPGILGPERVAGPWGWKP